MLGACVLVAALWGLTNPLLNRGGAGMEEKAAATGGGPLRRLGRQLWYLLSNWRFVVPFAVNQAGSALYVSLLGPYDLSVVVPVCNALTFAFTAVAARALGERALPPRAVLGLALIVAGVAVCLAAKADAA